MFILAREYDSALGTYRQISGDWTRPIITNLQVGKRRGDGVFEAGEREKFGNMAEIHVRTYYATTGAEVRESGLRTSSPRLAVNRTIELNNTFFGPDYITKISYSGSFVDPAFADLMRLVQHYGLCLENTEPWSRNLISIVNWLTAKGG